MPTLVSACSVLSGALRYAWLMSLRGRGMYCKVKLLTGEIRGRRFELLQDTATYLKSELEIQEVR